MKLSSGARTREVRVEAGTAWLDERRVTVAVEAAGESGLLEVWLDGRRRRAAVARDGPRVLVWCEGRAFAFERAGARPARSAEHTGDLVAPMPGRVRQTLVRPGDRVEKGQVVLVLEAMKMEHAIRAPRPGLVARVAHAEGDLVEAGAELAVIE